VARNALPTWEEWAEDMTAVLDVVESSRAALLAPLDVGPPAILFAAMHPERLNALVLVNTAARLLQDTDYPIGLSNETIDSFVGIVGATWGTTNFSALVTPNRTGDVEWARFLATTQRASMTPRSAAAQFDYVVRTNDVRKALPLIQTPTLVLNVHENPVVPIAVCRD
jgi:pimeloyl-ACP methyl ester carboxylesterase